jgi:hypothetical protein
VVTGAAIAAQAHALKRESRFLVDPGGFEDLACALTVACTPFHADDALGRLAWLPTVRLTGRSHEVFRGWGAGRGTRHRAVPGGGRQAVAAAGLV